MPQEYIEIRGARENNLKNVSLRISKRKHRQKTQRLLVVDQKQLGGTEHEIPG